MIFDATQADAIPPPPPSRHRNLSSLIERMEMLTTDKHTSVYARLTHCARAPPTAIRVALLKMRQAAYPDVALCICAETNKPPCGGGGSNRARGLRYH